jgi:diguanylate cyclase (GGDEF)-like protein/PAS domain S-box-containing protein
MKLMQRAVNEILAANQEPSIDGIIVIDGKGKILTFDTAAQNLFGYSREEVVGQPIDILMSHEQAQAHPEYLNNATKDIGRLEARQLHVEQTIIGKHKLGDSIPLAITVSNDSSTDSVRFIGVLQDLRKHEEQLTTVFQNFQATTDQLNQRIEFEGLLNTHGNLLLSSTADDFHTIMEGTLEAIGLFLSLDHCYILQLSEDLSKGYLWAEWRRSASLMAPFPASFDIPNSQIFLQALGTHDTITIEHGQGENNEVLFHLAQQLSPNGFHSAHITPISNDKDGIMGIIGFSVLDPSHPRPEAQLPLLSLATPLIINAWERHQLIIQSRKAEKRIQEKNKLLADRASFSQELLRASNLLYSNSRQDIQKIVQEVLSQAAIISGHQKAFIYFEQENIHQLKSFIQQYFDSSQLQQPQLISWVQNKLAEQDIIQLSDVNDLNFSHNEMFELEQHNIHAFTAIKLVKGGHSMGGIIFYNSSPVLDANDESLRFLQLTGQNLTAAIQHHSVQFDLELSEQNLSNANRMLSQQALHDALTGLSNRRAFDNGIEQEFDRATRHGTNLTLFICDIDHFKYYNDHFGHPQGDECLRQVAQVLQRTFNRAGEICTRYGGEEFAIILPSIDHSEAEFQAQRLLDNLERCKIQHAPESPLEFVTLSIGIAQLSAEHTYKNIFDLIDDADKALYQAKKNGRNQLAWALKAE